MKLFLNSILLVLNVSAGTVYGNTLSMNGDQDSSTGQYHPENEQKSSYLRKTNRQRKAKSCPRVQGSCSGASIQPIQCNGCFYRGLWEAQGDGFDIAKDCQIVGGDVGAVGCNNPNGRGRNCVHTASPSVSPSASPTQVPTSGPTVEPTTAPTPTPTIAPTEEPTDVPTPTPTTGPTLVPTSRPTAFPSASPTSTPTIVPTVHPTSTPTVAPTEVPPTSSPSVTPTTCNVAACKSECKSYCDDSQDVWKGCMAGELTGCTQNAEEEYLVCLSYYAENDNTFTVEEFETICSRHQQDILIMCCARWAPGRNECRDNCNMQGDSTAMSDCSYELPWYLS